MGNVDRNKPMPLYRQVAEILYSKVESGEWQPGDKIPSETELQLQLGVGRVTVRQAIEILTEEDTLVKIRGVGTFVCEKQNTMSASRTISFTESCAVEGKVVTNKVLSIESLLPIAKYRQLFGVKENMPLLRVKRLRYIDGVPAVLETAIYHNDYLSLQSADLSGSISAQFQKLFNVETVTQRGRLEAVSCTSEESVLLDIPENSPVLLIRDSTKTADGKLVHITKQILNTNKLQLII